MYSFEISDMTCGHCASTIAAAVRGIDPKAEVRADLARHQVDVLTSAIPEDVESAIRQAGYTPKAIVLTQIARPDAQSPGCCGGARSGQR